MKDGLTDKDRTGIQSILKSWSKVKKVILFGSRAMGTFRAASDIDLALEGDDLTLADILQLKSKIDELNLPVDVDLILMNSIVNEELKKHIENYGVSWIEKNNEGIKYKESQPSKKITPRRKISRLADIADIVMGQSPTGDTCNNSHCGIPLLNGPTEFGGFYPNPTQWTTDPKKISQINDILFCVRGSTTGRMNYANQSYAIGRGLAAIRHKENPICTRFIKALLDFNLDNLLSKATGSTFPNISKQQLQELGISEFSILEQLIISKIFSSLDDKIELNNKINANLEAQAQALFKSWFVDFEPFQEGEFVDSELGRIPKGWKIDTLSELIEIKYGKDHKKLLAGKIPVYGSGGVIRFVNKFLYDKESILIPRKGSLNNVTYINKPFWSVDTMFFSIIKKQCTAKYIYLLLKRRDLASMNSGSAVPSITTDTLNKLLIIIPTDPLLEKFENISNSIFPRIQHNLSENKVLSNIRDLLLPKLMSGEIRV